MRRIGLLCLGIVIWVWGEWHHPFHEWPLVWHVSGGVLNGHPNGRFQGRLNTLQTDFLEPGDVLLCHNRNGSYGYWTHAVIYVGQARTVDAFNFADGTVERPIGAYKQYDVVAVYRAAAISKQSRNLAAQAAQRAVGKPYDPFAAVTDPNSQYCSKLVWQSFKAAGVELCKPDTWIVPDHLAASRHLQCMGIWDSVG